MQPKVIITCAVTGAGDTVGKHPAIPVTPEQIANSAIDAAKAGAVVRQGAEVSEPDAEALLLYDLISVAHAVNENLFAPVSQNQFDALASFTFNIGAENFQRSAMEPVGITNASATNVRNNRASTNANAIDSRVSRVASWCGACGAVCEAEDGGVDRDPATVVGLGLLMRSSNSQLMG